MIGEDIKERPGDGTTEFWLWSMLRAKERLLERADESYNPKDCPLEDSRDKPIVRASRNHRTIAQFLDVNGSWRWDCPFCGEHFEE